MEAIVVRISFSEAFFKVHYTKGFRLTYPIPLPTSVAGMFGAFLGVERGKINELRKFLFGAKIKGYNGFINENATFRQYKSYGVEIGVATLNLINNPTYLIALAGEKEEIIKIQDKINKAVEFLPYGGQNDFFAEDWTIVGIDDVAESDEVTNYAPRDWVDLSTKSGLEVTLQILPVMHTLSDNPNFYFITKGKIRLNRKIPSTNSEKIGLYSLNNFKMEELDGKMGQPDL
ncbi:MAG: CRISPR-associated protein Cas5 [Candidatus Bathyarchaeia archaeon]